MLAAIGAQRQALDVTIVADGYRVDLLGDQVFVADLADGLDDLRPPIVAVLVADLDQIAADDFEDIPLAAQKLFVGANLAAQLVVFLDNLVAFQGGQLTQLHADDRFRLGLGHAVALLGADLLLQGGEVGVAKSALENSGRHGHVLQALLGLGPARRRAADGDQRIQTGDVNELRFDVMRPPLGLAEQVLGPAADDLDAMAQELLEHLLEGQRARPAVDQRQQDDARRLLQRRVLVKLVEHQLRVGVAFEVEDDAHRLAAASTAFVAHGADALDAFFLDQVADGFRQAIARVLEWDLVDDDLVPAAVLIDARPGPQRNLAAAGRV